jgi:hypothetical protein
VIGNRTIQDIELPGLVKTGGDWHYALGTVGEWILDYATYDPTYDPQQREPVFRRGLMRVTPSDGPQFLHALSDNEIALADLGDFVRLNSTEESRPTVLVDFDSGRFVSSYYDFSLESHTGRGWAAVFGDPLDAAPSDISKYWVPEDGQETSGNA